MDGGGREEARTQHATNSHLLMGRRRSYARNFRKDSREDGDSTWLGRGSNFEFGKQNDVAHRRFFNSSVGL